MKEYDKIGVVVNEAKLLQKEIDTTGISFEINTLKIYLRHFKKGVILQNIC